MHTWTPRAHWWLAGLVLLVATRLMAAEKSRPNVLLILSDDLNCRLGCYGAAEAKTPNIDRLAARGVRFDRAYCNYPVCNASRTSFLSGRYPEVTGVLGNATNPRVRLGEAFQFLPEYFRAQGYYTAGCGKIAHGAFPESLRWDYFTEPARGGEGDDDEGAKKQKSAKKGGATKAEKQPAKKGKTKAAPSADVPFGWQATGNADEEEPDGQVARRLVKLLGEKRDRPFFIAAGFHKPHVPHTAPKSYFDLHDPAKMPTPPEPKGHEKNIPKLANPPKYEPELTLEQRRAIIQHYYAATSFMDAQVGVLLEEMDRLKLWDSTVVVFMSDHGWHLGEHGGFYAKMSIMDESARAPLIVAAPGIASGAVTKGLVEYVDLFPTLVDLAGVAQPAGLQGTSFAPLLKDPAARGRDAVYTITLRGPGQVGRALHTDRYTYLEWTGGGQQLYDVAADPHEYANLAGDPQHAATLAAMQKALAQRRTAIGLSDDANNAPAGRNRR